VGLDAADPKSEYGNGMQRARAVTDGNENGWCGVFIQNIAISDIKSGTYKRFVTLPVTT